MKHAGTDLSNPGWDPATAPQGNVVPHWSPALALQLVAADRETCLVAWGGPPNLCLIGDLPTSSRVCRVRPPWWATRARVVAMVSGVGTIEIDDGAYNVSIPFDVDASTLTLSAVLHLRGGTLSDASPGDNEDRLVNLSAPPGSANNDLGFYRTGTSKVWSLTLQWWRGADTLSA